MWSMTILSPCMEIALAGQSFTHLEQWMQPTEQTSMTALPLSCVEQEMATLARLGMSSSTPRGQAFTQEPQPVQT